MQRDSYNRSRAQWRARADAGAYAGATDPGANNPGANARAGQEQAIVGAVVHDSRLCCCCGYRFFLTSHESGQELSS